MTGIQKIAMESVKQSLDLQIFNQDSKVAFICNNLCLRIEIFIAL